MHIYLASSSSRRLELLRQVNIEPVVIPSRHQEIELDLGDPVAYARNSAELKLKGAFPWPGNGVAVAADTVVHLRGRLLGKPETPEHAESMLHLLSGETHQVVTGVAMACHRHDVRVAHAVTQVEFRQLSLQEIKSYCATAEPMDKAGAYAIQGLAALFVKRIEGCYSNVVGLPLSLVGEMLRDLGLDLTTHWRGVHEYT